MRSYDLVRKALILAAIWILTSAVAASAMPFATLISMSVSYGPDLYDESSDILWSLIGGGLSSLILGLLPAGLILTYAETWAARLVTEDRVMVDVGPSLFYAASMLILGIYLMTSGGASLAHGVVKGFFAIQAEESALAFQNSLANGVWSAVHLAAGFLAYRSGARSVAHAA